MKIILILITALLSLSSSKSFRKATKSIESSSEYNGVYEGYVNKYKRKQFARIYIFRYDYISPEHTTFYNIKTRKSIHPFTVVGRFELYDNKNGRGNPKTTFFSAASYDVGTELQLKNIEKFQMNENGDIIQDPYNIRGKDFSIPKPNGVTSEIKVWNDLSGSYSKIKSYTKLPNEIEVFFNTALEEKAKRTRGSIVLSKNSNITITTKEFLNVNTTLKANLYGDLVTKTKQNPSIEEWDRIKEMVYFCLTSKESGGLLNGLKYFPAVDTLLLYIPNSGSSSPTLEENLFFKVSLNRDSKGLNCNVNNAQKLKNYYASIIETEKQKEKQQKIRLEQHQAKRISAGDQGYFQKNVLDRAFDKNFDWELIFKDKQTEYYLKLDTSSKTFQREATLIAVHDIKDENIAIFKYKKAFGNAIMVDPSVIDYLCKSLFPEIEKRMSGKYSMTIRNFVKDVNLSELYDMAWMKKKGELLTLRIAKYAGGSGKYEALPHYHLDYNNALTLKDAKALRKNLEKKPRSLKENDQISKRVSDFSKIYTDYGTDISIEMEESKKAAKKPGFVYYEDAYWEKFGKYNTRTSFLEQEVFKNIFLGNFAEVRYQFWKEQNEKNPWEVIITQNANVNFIELYCGFVVNYSSFCREYLPPNHDVLSISYQREDQFGSAVGGKYGEHLIHVDKKFSSYFQRYYSTYADTFRKAIHSDIEKFLKGKGCDCKAVAQLSENLLRFAEGNKSIQQSAQSISGKECD